MLIPAGVLVPVALAGAVGDAVTSALRRGQVDASPALLALVHDLTVAGSVPSPGSVAPPAGTDQLTPSSRAVTVDAAAAVLGITPRAVRKRIECGHLAAVKNGGRWWIEPPQP